MPSLQIRDLPEHIYQQIVELAEAERRSITQETIVLLEKALKLDARLIEAAQKIGVSVASLDI